MIIRSSCSIVLVGCLSVSLLSTPAQAADDETMRAAPESAEVTQAELGCLLTHALGLGRFLSSAPTSIECIRLCTENNIVPPQGWQPNEPVRRGALASILVKSMKAQAQVTNPNDPKECLAYLAEIGIPLDTVGAAVDTVEPIVDPVGTSVDSSTTDPISKKLTQEFNPTDELSSGVDMAALVRLGVVPRQEILEILTEAVVAPITPDPITPN